MKLIRTAALAAIAAGLTGGTVVTTATTVGADTSGCVTHHDYQRVHQGMTKSRVRRIFHAGGQFADGFAGGYTRCYGCCEAHRIEGGDGGAYVSYDGWTGRVLDKRWIGYA
jgi:hypothetical protein